jgi:anti-anti-sigma factor
MAPLARQGLEAQVRRRGAIAVVELHGDIDATAAPALQRAYGRATAGAARVLLDFRGVTYINSTGIALIVGLLARARDEGRPLLACGLSDHYREVFEITRLTDFMPIVPDEAATAGGAGVLGAPADTETTIR